MGSTTEGRDLGWFAREQLGFEGMARGGRACRKVLDGWLLETKYAHPALHNLSLRRKLTTNADDKYYALLRTARDGSERMVIALNYQPTPQAVEIDVAGVAAAGLLDVRNGAFLERHSTIKIDLPAYGYRFFTVVPPAR